MRRWESSEAVLANSPVTTGDPLIKKPTSRVLGQAEGSFLEDRESLTSALCHGSGHTPPLLLPSASDLPSQQVSKCNCSHSTSKVHPLGPLMPPGNVETPFSCYTMPSFLTRRQPTLPVQSPGTPRRVWHQAGLRKSTTLGFHPRQSRQSLLGYTATPPMLHTGLFPTGLIFTPHCYISSSSLCFTHKQVVILNQSGSGTAGPEGSNPAHSNLICGFNSIQLQQPAAPNLCAVAGHCSAAATLCSAQLQFCHD